MAEQRAIFDSQEVASYSHVKARDVIKSFKWDDLRKDIEDMLTKSRVDTLEKGYNLIDSPCNAKIKAQLDHGDPAAAATTLLDYFEKTHKGFAMLGFRTFLRDEARKAGGSAVLEDLADRIERAVKDLGVSQDAPLVSFPAIEEVDRKFDRLTADVNGYIFDLSDRDYSSLHFYCRQRLSKLLCCPLSSDPPDLPIAKEEFMVGLSKYWNAFSFGLLEDVVEFFDMPELLERLKAHTDLLGSFCRMTLGECRKKGIKLHKSQHLKITYQEDPTKFTLGRILHFQEFLKRDCGIEQSLFEGFDTSSVILFFLISHDAASQLQSKLDDAAVFSIGVCRIEFEGLWEISLQTQGSHPGSVMYSQTSSSPEVTEPIPPPNPPPVEPTVTPSTRLRGPVPSNPPPVEHMDTSPTSSAGSKRSRIPGPKQNVASRDSVDSDTRLVSFPDIEEVDKSFDHLTAKVHGYVYDLSDKDYSSLHFYCQRRVGKLLHGPLSSHLPMLPEEKDKLMVRLSKYWNALSFGLLEDVVEFFNIPELRERLKAHTDLLGRFCKRTLGECRKKRIKLHKSKYLTTTYRKDPTKFALGRILEFQEFLKRKCGIEQSLFEGFDTSSVILFFLISHDAASQLQSKLDDSALSSLGVYHIKFEGLWEKSLQTQGTHSGSVMYSEMSSSPKAKGENRDQVERQQLQKYKDLVDRNYDPFHEKCSKGVFFRERRLVAIFPSGVVFSVRPIPLGGMFQVKLLDKDVNWFRSLAIGFTLQDPDTIDPVSMSIDDLMRSKDYWLFRSRTVYHDGNYGQILSISTFDLVDGDSIGCCTTRGGDLEIYINGQKRAVGWHNVPVDKPLWGVVCMFGRARTIQSEFCCVESHPPDERGSPSPSPKRYEPSEDSKESGTSK